MTRKEEIAKYLRNIREVRGLSIYKAAKLAGIKISQVHDIEQGKKAYTVNSLFKYCTALRVDVKLSVKKD